jgi:hypothetical protein
LYIVVSHALHMYIVVSHAALHVLYIVVSHAALQILYIPADAVKTRSAGPRFFK